MMVFVPSTAGRFQCVRATFGAATLMVELIKGVMVVAYLETISHPTVDNALAEVIG